VLSFTELPHNWQPIKRKQGSEFLHMLEESITAGRTDGWKGPLEQVGSFWARLHNCYKRLLASPCLSVRPYGTIFVKFDI